MIEMPNYIKVKLRRLAKLYKDVSLLDNELREIFEKYNVDVENLSAIGNGEFQTEALAFITNAEGDIEKNISEIEEVFLYYTNKNRRN
jgi:hypothetical protein